MSFSLSNVVVKTISYEDSELILLMPTSKERKTSISPTSDSNFDFISIAFSSLDFPFAKSLNFHITICFIIANIFYKNRKKRVMNNESKCGKRISFYLCKQVL